MIFIRELFKNRGMQYAVLASSLWHLFFFFALTIDVYMPASAAKKEMRIYFVGPVLSDDAFNLVVAGKPELSKTLYRSSELVRETLVPESPTMTRRQPGDLVSVPLGRTTWNTLRGILPSEKPLAKAEFVDKLSVDLFTNPYPMSGALKDRDILFMPEKPRDPRFSRDPGDEGGGKTVFEIQADAQGTVTRVDNIVSSGDPATDLVWTRFVKKWQFMPKTGAGSGDDGIEKGVVTFRFGDEPSKARHDRR